MPESWSTIFNEHKTSARTNTRIVPIAASPDGHILISSLYSTVWSGVVAIDLATMKQTRLRKFSGSDDQATAADSDGTYYAWIIDHSATSTSDWELWFWDAESRITARVASVPRTEGRAAGGPYVYPVVEHGFLAWTQSTAGGDTEVHLFNLRSKRDEIISRNHPGAPSFAWPFLLWTESIQGGRPGHLRLFDVARHQSEELPAGLRDVTPAFLAGASGLIAWVDALPAGYRTLRYSTMTPDAASPTTVVTAATGDYSEFPHIAWPFIAWNSSTATLIADIRSHSYTQVSPEYGYANAHGSGLLIAYNDSRNGAASRSLTGIVLNTADLPQLTSCP